jgi:hypothetical protein
MVHTRTHCNSVNLRPVCHIVVTVECLLSQSQRGTNRGVEFRAIKGVHGKLLVDNVHSRYDSG